MRGVLSILAGLVLLTACDSMADRTLRGQLEAINTRLPAEAARDIVIDPFTIDDSCVTLNFRLTSVTPNLGTLHDSRAAHRHLINTLRSRDGMAAMLKFMRVSNRDLRVCYKVAATGDSTVFTIPASELK